MNAERQSREPAGASLVIILAVSAAVTAVAGFGYYRKLQADRERAAGAQLVAIADWRTDQINRWRQQLREEADGILEASAVAASVRDYLAAPRSAEAATHLQIWLNAFGELPTWPASGLATETLLVRREGEEVVDLNPVRGQDDAAPPLRIPLTRRSSPAVRAVLGEEGLVEGHDHRGVPVLAAIRPLADSSWFIVVQAEQTEIRKSLGEQAWISGSVFGLLMLATGLALTLAWYHREHRFLQQLKEQDELLAGQERMRIAMNLVQAAEWELDGKERRFDRSMAHDRLFGYDSLLPKWDLESLLQHVAEADRAMVSEKLHEALQTKADWHFESRIIRCDGTPGWILMAGRARPDPLGNLGHQVGVVQDITARKQAAQALAESEDHYRTLIESLPHLFWTSLPDGSWDYLSPQWVNYTGVAAREQLGDAWSLRLHAEDRPRVQAEWLASMKGNRLFEADFRIRRVDGAYRWFRARALPLRNLRGQVIKWFGVSTDIEDRKQAEDSLRRSQQRLALHVQQTPLAVIEWDTRFRVTGWNPAAERIFGFTALEACGRQADQLIVPTGSRARMAAIRAALLEGQGGDSGIHENLTKDGRTILCEWFNTPLMDADGRVMAVASLAVDVTERKQQEDLREHLVSELESKNAELEGLIYVASHDLRSPLVNVQGFSRRLEKACDELLGLVRDPDFPLSFREPANRIVAEQIPKSLSFIRSGVSKMDALINGLLRVSRLGRVALHWERLDMNQLVREVLAAQAFQVQNAGTEVRVDDLPECQGDSGLVNQVFSNLLDNALKYRQLERPLQIQISGRVEGRQAIYCVADTGLGIASEHQEKIWEMFYRLNPDGQVAGEGLGLNLVRRILDRHHGRVWVESVPGEGSRFFVSVPADR
jgi:PAS domain S-box-containing protein